MDQVLGLYEYFRSSASFRVRIALHYKEMFYKNIQYIKYNVDLRNRAQDLPSYRAVNPLGVVPTLINGSITVHESAVIIDYLDELYPEHLLIPKNLTQRVYVKGIASMIDSDIHPLLTSRVVSFLKNELNANEEMLKTWRYTWLTKGLNALEQIIKNSSLYQGKLCCEDIFTIADIYLVVQMYGARQCNFDLSPYPTLIAIDTEIRKNDAVQIAWPRETA